MFEVFNEHYAVHCNDNTKSYDGIDELLKSLKEQKVKTAVVSNKADYAVQTLEKNISTDFLIMPSAKNRGEKSPALTR